MRKSTALKTLLRSPLKTLLTFLLIAAASFALFSRVTDYAVTTRESAKAKSFYNGVAALDNSVPPVIFSRIIDGVEWHSSISLGDKPWPSNEQMKEFTSLPGITLTDTRYMTAGLIGDYKRLPDTINSYEIGDMIFEATYDGYEMRDNPNYIYLSFHDITLHASEIEFTPDESLELSALTADETPDGKNPYPQAFFDKLEKGSRCLVAATNFDGDYDLSPAGIPKDKAFRVIDGLGDDYLETEEFALYKENIESINQGHYIYDIVYTSDMRAIPRYNERTMIITEGRPLTSEDTDACVVSELFLKTNKLALGDKITIELGDKLFPQSALLGAKPSGSETTSNYIDTAELEIIGAYENQDTTHIQDDGWNYSPSTVFVPSSLLPVEVPKDYEPRMGEFSVFIENAQDIDAFHEAAEPLVAEMGLGLRFSDGGWSSMKNNFQTGSLASFLSAMLYVIGAALALVLSIYLYIGRSQKTYAIMRTLGIPGNAARNSVALPLILLSVLAIPAGGAAGLSYASQTIAHALAGISGKSAPSGYVYVLDAKLPVDVIIFCLISELLFVSAVTLVFLRRMKKIPPLELLQEGTLRAGASKRDAVCVTDSSSVPAGINFARIYEADKITPHGRYGAARQVGAYILRHIRRGIGKAAISFILAAVLTAGIGMFVLARITFSDAYHNTPVKGRATEFASSSMGELAKSDLIKDFYYFNKFAVRVNDAELHTQLIATNDLNRYLTDEYTITFAKGYEISVLNGTGAVCLVGKTLADSFGIQPGEEISLISENFYNSIKEVCEDQEEQFAETIAQKTGTYKVAGIIDSGEENISSSIFAGMNESLEQIYGNSFPVTYSEFTLSDNDKLVGLNSLLEELKMESQEISAPMASFHIDSESLENIKRVRDLLASLFPIAVAAAVLIGLFGPGLVVMQSAKEAAFLRVIGVTKKRARCMLVLEQILLCAAGLTLVAAGLALSNPGLFARSTQTLATCWMLYFLGCICGASAAAIQVTRHRILELLQVKE